MLRDDVGDFDVVVNEFRLVVVIKIVKYVVFDEILVSGVFVVGVIVLFVLSFFF